MKSKNIEHEMWLDLSDAAGYLGVHFTTLRRWANAGEIAFIRTPGGRRRFSIQALERFLKSRVQGSGLKIVTPLEDRAVDHARQNVRNLPVGENWLGKMSEDQRLVLKGSGRRLMALLLQYNGRAEGGEAFLEEGRRITGEYSQVCGQSGFTLQETVHVFLFFRRSILDAIHETGYLGGCEDHEGQRLFRRTNEFLDDLLTNLIDRFMEAPETISDGRN
jgi:excisionase family DNA binding protein